MVMISMKNSYELRGSIRGISIFNASRLGGICTREPTEAT